MLKKIIQSTRETVESSSIHAIPNISRNKYSLIKIIWLICFLISFGFCSFSIYSSVLDYLDYNVVTNIKIINTNQLTFPVINICNLNLYDTDYSFNTSKALFKTIRPDPSFLTLAQAWTATLLVKLGFDKKLLGHSIHDVIITCRFNQLECDLTKDFEYYYDIIYGNCFRYNSGRDMLGNKVNESKITSQTGKKNGLNLELYTGSASENDYPFSVENGYIIFITNESLNSGVESNDGIKISSGLSTSINLNKYSIIKKAKPYSECTDNLITKEAYNSECYRKMFEYSNSSEQSLKLKYKFADCYFLCFQRFVGKACECQLSFFNYVYYKDMRICFMPESGNKSKYPIDCPTKAFINFTQTSEFIKECDCPVECETNNFITSHSTAEYPTMNHARYLMNQSVIRKRFMDAQKTTVTYSDLKQNVARVQIYYSELKETIISENAKTSIYDLVSIIGGTLGLFLGWYYCIALKIII